MPDSPKNSCRYFLSLKDFFKYKGEKFLQGTFFQKSSTYKSKYTIKPLLSQIMVHFTQIIKSPPTLKVLHFGIKNTKVEKLLFLKSEAYKSKYTLKPMLGQNMMQFTVIIK